VGLQIPGQRLTVETGQVFVQFTGIQLLPSTLAENTMHPSVGGKMISNTISYQCISTVGDKKKTGTDPGHYYVTFQQLMVSQNYEKKKDLVKLQF